MFSIYSRVHSNIGLISQATSLLFTLPACVHHMVPSDQQQLSKQHMVSIDSRCVEKLLDRYADLFKEELQIFSKKNLVE